MADDREQQIRDAAYRLWQEGGEPEGQHEQHWHEAARLIDGAGGDASAGTGGTVPDGGIGAGSIGTGGGSTAGAASSNAA